MRRLALLGVLGVLGVFASLLWAPTPAYAAPAVQFNNPLIAQRADPHIWKHTDGFYYLTATVPAYDRIVLRRSTTLQGLATASEQTIWTRHASGEMGAHIWAPEIHFIDGRWFIYFAAGWSNDIWRIRMYVLENSSANPMSGTWVERGRIVTPLDTFSLDATTFTHNGVRYLAWAQHDGVNSGTGLYIARMTNPWTITGTPAKISSPTFAWERQGHNVNEGPAVIKRNGRIFMAFSASATDANYCIGLLTASDTANLLSPSSWTKTSTPVFVSNTNTSQYGPGHNSFTVSEDGQSDIMVYHDRSYRDISGDPLNDPNRRTRLQKLYWNANGTPNFGIPVSDGMTPMRFRSQNVSNGYIRHFNFRARVEANVTVLADSQFRIVPGLTGQGTVSLESANFPGYFLRHRNFELFVERNDGTLLFRQDASFFRRAGLADAAGVSFESGNLAGRYIRHSSSLLYVQAVSTATDRADATYHTE